MSVIINTNQTRWEQQRSGRAGSNENAHVVSQQAGQRGRVPNPPAQMRAAGENLAQAGFLFDRRIALNNTDPFVQSLTRKILKLALIMGVVAIVRNITLLYLQYYDISMVEMLLPLMIPYCG